MSTTVRELIKDLKVSCKKIVKYIRCDNAGEINLSKRKLNVTVWVSNSNGLYQALHSKMEGSRENLVPCMGELELCLRKLDLPKKLKWNIE